MKKFILASSLVLAVIALAVLVVPSANVQAQVAVACPAGYVCTPVIVSQPVTYPTIPTSDATTTVNSSNLVLSYDSAQKESLLTATFNITVTAGRTGVSIYKNFPGVDFVDPYQKNGNVNSKTAVVNPVSTANVQTDSNNQTYYFLMPGGSINLQVVATVNPKQLFAGTYSASLSFLYANAGTVPNNAYSLTVAPNVTNAVTIVGEVSPYITSVSPNPVTVGQRFTIVGKGLQSASGLSIKTVSIDGANISNNIVNGSNDWTSLFFNMPMLTNGYHTVAVTDSVTGASNNFSFQVQGGTGSSTTQPSITVLSPAGGENLMEGSQFTIRWTTLGLASSQNMSIVLNAGSGGTGKSIVNSIPNTGSYVWTVKSYPAFFDSESNGWITPNGKYNIYVTCPGCNFNHNFGQSGVFTITSPNPSPSVSPSPIPSVGCYTFNTNLSLGSRGADVVALQTWLIANGYDIPGITTGGLAKGEFGQATAAAVYKFQTSVGISATGFVGPLTRTYLNGKCTNSSTGNSGGTTGGPNLNGPVISNTSAILGACITGNTGGVSATVACSATYYFTLTAGNDTIYVSTDPGIALATTTTGYPDITSNNASIANVVTNPNALPGDFDDHFVVPAGGSRTFVYTGIIRANNAPNGTKTFAITGISYGTNPSNLRTYSITYGLQNLKVWTVIGNGQSTSTTQPTITVLSPNGGETLTEGSQYTIRWNTSGLPSSQNMSIVLNAGSGGTGKSIVNNIPNTGSYTWIVKSYPAFYDSESSSWITPNSKYNIYVTCPGCNFNHNFGQSGVFTIVSSLTPTYSPIPTYSPSPIIYSPIPTPTYSSSPTYTPPPLYTPAPTYSPTPTPVTTAPLGAYCYASTFNSGVPGATWSAAVSGGKTPYQYSWSVYNDVSAYGEGSTASYAFMDNYSTAGTKQAAVRVSDANGNSTSATCSATIPTYYAPTVTPTPSYSPSATPKPSTSVTPTPTPSSSPRAAVDQNALSASIWDAIKAYYEAGGQ